MISLLKGGNYGAVCVNAYGYDRNYLKEKPFQMALTPLFYREMDPFVQKCANKATFISSMIINRTCIKDINAQKYVGTALVQTYLFYEAISRNQRAMFIREYLIAAKRIESKDYDAFKIFGQNFNAALQYLVERGLAKSTVLAINRKLLWYLFPIHLISLRVSGVPIARTQKAYEDLYERYRKEPLFWLCCVPILKLPSALARFFGFGLIVLGRMINGEFGRLWVAARESFNRKDAA